MAGQGTVNAGYEPVAAPIRADASDNWNDQVAGERFVGRDARFVRG